MSPDVSIPTYEKSILYTGWGLYHYFMIGIASACAFSQATSFMSMPFTIPITVCDMAVGDSTATTVNVCFSLGMAFGGFLLVSTSDITGKKCMITFSLMTIFGSTFACGFAHGPVIIISCSFFLGCGLVTNAVCVKIHLAEVLPTDKRGRYLIFPDFFWSFGYIVFALISWLLTPSIMSNLKLDMRLTTWRVMFGLSGACSIMVACATALLQPSPRYLIMSKRYTEAVEALKRIYAINNSKHSETYTIRPQDLENCISDYGIGDEPNPINCSEQAIVWFKKIEKLTFLLFKKQFVLVTILLAAVKLAVIIGILPTNIWLAKMLQTSDNEDCNFTSLDILHLDGVFNNCTFSFSPTLYKNYFLIAVNILIGQIIAFFLIDLIGRRILIFVGFVACGASGFALGYIQNHYFVKMGLSFIIMMSYSIIDSVANVILIEAYPTAFRGTASGVLILALGCINAFIKGYLSIPCQASFIIMGSFMLAASAVCYFLPELRRQAMVE